MRSEVNPISASDASDVLVNPTGFISVEELNRIVMLSGIGMVPVSGRRHTTHRVVAFGSRPFKVRAYRSAEAAQRQFEKMWQVRHLFPTCHGRVGHCLVWDYVRDFGLPPGRNLMEDIGCFLAEVAETRTEPLSTEEFAEWCDDVQRAGIFGAGSIRRIQDYFERTSPGVQHWNLEYIDGVPKNFVYSNTGRLISIDAKHLFPGPRGLGLVKLFCHQDYLISEGDYRTILSGFREQIAIPEYDDPEYFGFLMFYYSMLLLADNAHAISRRYNMESNRNRHRKRTILEAVHAPQWLRIWERARSDIPFYALRTNARLSRALELIRNPVR